MFTAENWFWIVPAALILVILLRGIIKFLLRTGLIVLVALFTSGRQILMILAFIAFAIFFLGRTFYEFGWKPMVNNPHSMGSRIAEKNLILEVALDTVKMHVIGYRNNQLSIQYPGTGYPPQVWIKTGQEWSEAPGSRHNFKSREGGELRLKLPDGKLSLFIYINDRNPEWSVSVVEENYREFQVLELTVVDGKVAGGIPLPHQCTAGEIPAG